MTCTNELLGMVQQDHHGVSCCRTYKVGRTRLSADISFHLAQGDGPLSPTSHTSRPSPSSSTAVVPVSRSNRSGIALCRPRMHEWPIPFHHHTYTCRPYRRGLADRVESGWHEAGKCRKGSAGGDLGIEGEPKPSIPLSADHTERRRRTAVHCRSPASSERAPG